MPTSPAPIVKRSCYFRAAATFVRCTAFLLVVQSAFAAPTDSEGVESIKFGQRNTGPICGISCVYVLLKLYKHNVPFESLLRPEYLSSNKGSSFGELAKAISDHSLSAIAVSRLTTRELKSLDYPAILRVRASVDSPTYDHYVLYLGHKGNQVHIYDPPYAPEWVGAHELTPLWDGRALVVGAQEPNLRKVFGFSRGLFILWMVGAVVVLAAINKTFVRRVCQRRSDLHTAIGLSLAQALLIGLYTVTIGFAYHKWHNEGLLKRPEGVRSVQCMHMQVRRRCARLCALSGLRTLGPLSSPDYELTVLDA